ncbi:MAG: carbamoyl phosphate synthase large subunit, partial [Pseudomonadota bacterium]|nr:carbamoyl phosphate synthase large subunit [Pseudomonadota bacterium]
VDTLLSPEMKSTGEAMGVGLTFAEAFIKSQMACGIRLPKSGRVFISVKDSDKLDAVELAQSLVKLKFIIVATRGTAKAMAEAGIPVTAVNKVKEGRPHIVDMIKNGEISLIVNTVEDKGAVKDSLSIRSAALQHKVVYYTTMAGAKAASLGMQHFKELDVYSLQGLHQQLAN